VTVWIYVDTSKDVGNPEHLKVFATADAAESWFKANAPKALRSSMTFWSNRHRRIAVCDDDDHDRCLLDSARRSLICLFFRTWILKSSIRLPDPNCATSQRGCLPRPDQVSEGRSGLRYFGETGG
jgi:hypothetical protein